VVGGGVVGLLTAVRCARAGARVDLFDRDEIPSRWATSYDRHRVVRALHPGDAALTVAAARALAGWSELGRRLGPDLLYPVGALTAMAPARVPAVLALLARTGLAGARLDPDALARRYPVLRFPAGLAAVSEPGAAVVLADRMLAALAGWLAAQPGVRLYPRHRVVSVPPGGVLRLYDGGVRTADTVVVAAGPWSGELVPPVLRDRLVLYRQSTLSYRPADPAGWAGLPAVPALGTAGGAWLIPPVAGTPVRLSAASACRPAPELAERTTPVPQRDRLVAEFGPLLAGFDPARVTAAADGYYLADPAGPGPLLATLGDGATWLYPACGGMSFKLAPLVAGVLAGLATGRPPEPTGLAVLDRPHRIDPAGVAAHRSATAPGGYGAPAGYHPGGPAGGVDAW